MRRPCLAEVMGKAGRPPLADPAWRELLRARSAEAILADAAVSVLTVLQGIDDGDTRNCCHLLSEALAAAEAV